MSQTVDFDAIVIGAGIAGMYQLHRLRGLGLTVRVFEAGGDIGGTWYWNRYPGARFDSESYSYGYSFSPELLQDWSWSERFAAQPETLAYLNHVADRFELRRDIQFDTRVKAAAYDEASGLWTVTLEGGAQAVARFLILAVGALSTPIKPDIPGAADFRGQVFHTGLWPYEPVSLAGKRVAVLGTGSSGVQVIQEAAKTAASLTVYQRSANWCAPLRNTPIDEAEQRTIKQTYADIFARCAETPGSFLHRADPRSALEVSEAEREAFFEARYASAGFSVWLGNFRDTMLDAEANRLMSDFVARKIRQRVKDPKTAEALIPKTHGFGTRRVALETGFYEVFNQENVTLVDLNEEPIERITPEGIKTSAGAYDFDIIVYATGFDAILGSFNRIDIRGRGGLKLTEKWAGGPKTFLGITIEGFPNLVMHLGPHSGGLVCNMPRCIEQSVDWATGLMTYTLDNGFKSFEAEAEAEEKWTRHVIEVAAGLLLGQTRSWFTGINQNIAGRDTLTTLVYLGGAPRFKERCDQVAASGYAGLAFETA